MFVWMIILAFSMGSLAVVLLLGVNVRAFASFTTHAMMLGIAMRGSTLLRPSGYRPQ